MKQEKIFGRFEVFWLKIVLHVVLLFT